MSATTQRMPRINDSAAYHDESLDVLSMSARAPSGRLRGSASTSAAVARANALAEALAAAEAEETDKVPDMLSRSARVPRGRRTRSGHEGGVVDVLSHSARSPRVRRTKLGSVGTAPVPGAGPAKTTMEGADLLSRSYRSTRASRRAKMGSVENAGLRPGAAAVPDKLSQSARTSRTRVGGAAMIPRPAATPDSLSQSARSPRLSRPGLGKRMSGVFKKK